MLLTGWGSEGDRAVWHRRIPRYASEIQIAQAWTVCRLWAAAIPMEFTLSFLYRPIFDAGVPAPVSAELVVLPILVAIGAEPIAGIIVVFVGEPHCDAIFGERPQFLDQAVIQLALPLSC
jgi:hypothetical protein